MSVDVFGIFGEIEVVKSLSVTWFGVLGKVSWFVFFGEVEVGNNMSVVELSMPMVKFFDNVVSSVGLLLVSTSECVFNPIEMELRTEVLVWSQGDNCKDNL